MINCSLTQTLMHNHTGCPENAWSTTTTILLQRLLSSSCALTLVLSLSASLCPSIHTKAKLIWLFEGPNKHNVLKSRSKCMGKEIVERHRINVEKKNPANSNIHRRGESLHVHNLVCWSYATANHSSVSPIFCPMLSKRSLTHSVGSCRRGLCGLIHISIPLLRLYHLSMLFWSIICTVGHFSFWNIYWFGDSNYLCDAELDHVSLIRAHRTSSWLCRSHTNSTPALFIFNQLWFPLGPLAIWVIIYIQINRV